MENKTYHSAYNKADLALMFCRGVLDSEPLRVRLKRLLFDFNQTGFIDEDELVDFGERMIEAMHDCELYFPDELGNFHKKSLLDKIITLFKK